MISGMSCSMTTSVRSSSLFSSASSVTERLGLALGDARRRFVEQQAACGCSATRQAISVMRRVPVDSSWICLVAVAVETHRRRPAPSAQCAPCVRSARVTPSIDSEEAGRLRLARATACTVSCTVIVGNSAASWNDRIRPRRAACLGAEVGDVVAVEA